MQDQVFGRSRQGDNWERVSQIRDKFEFDREKRMRDKGRLNAIELYFTCLHSFLCFGLIDFLDLGDGSLLKAK